MIPKKILLEKISSDTDFGKILGLKKGTVDKTEINFGIDEIYSWDDEYIYFDFDGPREMLEFLFGEREDDNIMLMNDDEINDWAGSMNSGFGYDYYDDWDNDWKEGYTLDALNMDNKMKVMNILKIVGPKYLDEFKINLRGNFSQVEKLANLLKNIEDMEDSLGDVYLDAQNTSAKVGAEKELELITNNMMSAIGFESDGRIYNYYKMPLTKVALHFSRYGDSSDSLRYILRKASERQNNFPPNDNTWEFLNENFDSETFQEIYQEGASNVLDSVMESLTDGLGYSEEFTKLFDYVNDQYELGRVNRIEDGMTYIINSIDPSTLKLNVRFSKGWRGKNFQLTLKDFENLVSNYTLFDIFEN